MQALLSRLPGHDSYDSPATYRIEPMARPRYREIEKCRVCGNSDLVPVLSLGEQHLTGVFPRGLHATPAKGPLELVACTSWNGNEACGLIQLCQSYDLDEMFDENYGHRSSLDEATLKHFESTVRALLERAPLQTGDLVLDIGSNDGTLLSFYPTENVTAVGIDPIVEKFASDYREDIKRIPGFFSAALFRENFGEKKARIVTSISVLNRLENPLEFVQDVASILEDEGIWHFEIAYLPSMIRTLGYDRICHEHLEHYCLRQIKWMLDRSDLKILHVDFNESHGGSLAVTVARRSASHAEEIVRVEKLLEAEETQGLTTLEQQRAFESSIGKHKTELLWFLHALKSEKRNVLGYGASTNANVLLQHCGISRDLLPAIVEANKEKCGCFTPGTNIPIISETEAGSMNPDYLLVFPGQSRGEMMERESAFLARGGKMIFPLPSVEVVG